MGGELEERSLFSNRISCWMFTTQTHGLGHPSHVSSFRGNGSNRQGPCDSSGWEFCFAWVLEDDLSISFLNGCFKENQRWLFQQCRTFRYLGSSETPGVLKVFSASISLMEVGYFLPTTLHISGKQHCLLFFCLLLSFVWDFTVNLLFIRALVVTLAALFAWK